MWGLIFYSHVETLTWPYYFTKKKKGGGPKTSINPPLFIEMSVSSQESEWSCICVLARAIDLLTLSIHDTLIYIPSKGRVDTIHTLIYIPSKGRVGTIHTWYTHLHPIIRQGWHYPYTIHSFTSHPKAELRLSIHDTLIYIPS